MGEPWVKPLQRYMEHGPLGRKVEASELTALSPDDRQELGALARKACEEEGIDYTK